MPPELQQDAFGSAVVVVKQDDLKDFPKLISWLREHGHFSNILKLRLHDEDRRDPEILVETMHLLKEALKTKVHDEEKGMVFAYNPDAQIFYKSSLQDHVYQFMKADCTKQERQKFVKMVTKQSTYCHQSNCCTEILKAGDKDTLRQHLFSSMASTAPLNDVVRHKEEKWQKIQGPSVNPEIDFAPEEVTPILYGAGIQLDPDTPIQICSNFSLSTLGTVIDMLDEKYDGIAYPYLYCGVKHSAFPWHIEDGGLYSINYLFAGTPKVWYGIAPDHFGLVDRIASGFNIDKGHTACRALLVDHKTLVADPEYLQKAHSIPYTTIIQEVGDFVITPPFGLHSGFNLGNNAAFAANFGDEPWIELGMYAPVCTCRDDQVHFDLVPLIKEFRPDLLEKYLRETCLLFPPGHPRDVTNNTLVPEHHQKVKQPVSIPARKTIVKHVSDPASKDAKKLLQSRTLYCPVCPSKFAENKMKRLEGHIETCHANDKEHLLRVIKVKYPAWKPKTKTGFKCQICGILCRGSITHLYKHHQRKHKGEPFKHEAPK